MAVTVEEKGRNFGAEVEGAVRGKGPCKRLFGAKMSKKSGAEKLSGAELRAAEEISGWLQKIQSCPEFRPSPEEFEDPAAYIRNLDPKGRPYGEAYRGSYIFMQYEMVCRTTCNAFLPV